jgi:uncharacterized protein YdaU (DUF1376 family)
MKTADEARRRYLGDTGHLTNAQHGSYLLLIFHYWRTGGLPEPRR